MWTLEQEWYHAGLGSSVFIAKSLLGLLQHPNRHRIAGIGAARETLEQMLPDSQQAYISE